MMKAVQDTCTRQPCQAEVCSRIQDLENNGVGMKGYTPLLRTKYVSQLNKVVAGF